MAGNNDFVDLVKSKVSIVDIVSESVKLQKRGNKHVGLCPFHKEKTPSFSVDESKGFYHCFGCNASGDVIKYVMETKTLSFIEALKDLALSANLEMPKNIDFQTQKSPGLYDLNEDVKNFYVKSLFKEENKAALNYLYARGFNDETIKKFSIGYSPNSFSETHKEMLSRGYLLEDMQKLGLVAISSRNEPYDKFRNRVMFPILDQRKKVVGFGGRALSDDDIPKYLNSSESDIFHKKNHVYALPYALESDFYKKNKYFIVTEGYTDVNILHQNGISSAVASLGTAFGTTHLQQLAKFCKDHIICFDGDSAGRSAALRVASEYLPFIEHGVIAKFVFLPQNHDPASYVLENGPGAFLDHLELAQHLSDFIFEALVQDFDVKIPEIRSRVEAQLNDFIKVVSNDEIKRSLKGRFKFKLNQLIFGDNQTKYYGSRVQNKGGYDLVQAAVLFHLITHGELFLEYQESLEIFDFQGDLLKVYEASNDFISEGHPLSGLLEHLEKQGLNRILQEKIFNLTMTKLYPGYKSIDSARHTIDAIIASQKLKSAVKKGPEYKYNDYAKLGKEQEFTKALKAYKKDIDSQFKKL